MSATPKVKLPSIAELTSHSGLPPVGADGLPLPLMFRASAPSAKHLPSGSESSLPPSRNADVPSLPATGPASAAAPSSARETPAPHPPVLYQYYSYGPNVSPPPPMYLHSYYHPVYYPPPIVGNGYVPPQDSHQVYNVPEVINKPMNKCHRCGTTETPEWRRGPNGLRTLCNACGLFHAKLVKRKGAVLAAEEVLNNKVCKGKNGRRVSIKKQAMEDSKKRLRGTGVTDIPPIPYGAAEGHYSQVEHAPAHMLHSSEYLYSQMPRPEGPHLAHYGQRVALPPPVWGNSFQPLPALRN